MELDATVVAAIAAVLVPFLLVAPKVARTFASECEGVVRIFRGPAYAGGAFFGGLLFGNLGGMRYPAIALLILLAAVFCLVILVLEAIVAYNRRRQSNENEKTRDSLGDHD